MLLLSVVDAFFQALLTRSADRKQGMNGNVRAVGSLMSAFDKNQLQIKKSVVALLMSS